MIRNTSPLIALAIILASTGVASLPSVGGGETAERRSLASTAFLYSYKPTCCARQDSTCQRGKVDVILTAQAHTGNSYSKSLHYGTTSPFPEMFNNKEYCDDGGIICWTGTASSDTTGQVCVHYANDYNCATFTTQSVDEGKGCVQGVTITAAT